MNQKKQFQLLKKPFNSNVSFEQIRRKISNDQKKFFCPEFVLLADNSGISPSDSTRLKDFLSSGDGLYCSISEQDEVEATFALHTI